MTIADLLTVLVILYVDIATYIQLLQYTLTLNDNEGSTKFIN